MSNDHSIEADYYLYGIELGILGFDKAIEWADRIIEVESEPDVEIIDVALARPRGRNGVMEALQAVKGTRRPEIAGGMLLKDLSLQLNNGGDMRVIASKALSVAWATQMPESIVWALDHIEDDIALAQQGVYADINQCEIELKKLLEHHQVQENT